MSGDVNIPVSAGQLDAVGLQARMATRTNFSIPLLAGAARFTREALAIETANAGQPFGDFVFDLMQCVPAAVTNAYAALESYVNELGVDCIVHWGKRHDHALLRELWPIDDRRERTLEKLRAAYSCSGIEVDRSRRPWQPIEVVVKLRNALVHFRPEWSDELRDHKALSEKLAPWFKGSPFFADTEPLFPRRFVSHSCAEWAVESVRDLILDFEARSGVRPTIRPNLKFFETR